LLHLLNGVQHKLLHGSSDFRIYVIGKQFYQEFLI
jgi:hypothetical protein